MTLRSRLALAAVCGFAVGTFGCFAWHWGGPVRPLDFAESAGVKLLVQMTSISQAYGYEHATIPRPLLQRMQPLQDAVNGSLEQFSHLSVREQRAALMDFIGLCRSKQSEWEISGVNESGPRFDPYNPLFLYDCGKLDWLAVAEGRKPALYEGGFRRDISGSRGQIAFLLAFAPWEAEGNWMFKVEPLIEKADLDKAQRLISEGYFDMRPSGKLAQNEWRGGAVMHRLTALG